jgi:squalene-hopene/tetraprenyl-beta-curcumene cyclase
MRRVFLPFVLCLALGLVVACGNDENANDNNANGSASKGAAPEAKGRAPASTSAATGLSAALKAQVVDAQKKGAAYLRGQQDDKGGFGDSEIKLPGNVAYTAMAVTALVGTQDSTAAAKDEAITKGLTFLQGFQQENGSVVDNPKVTNYATAAAISAFAAARRDAFRSVQAKAVSYLEGSQIVGDEGDPSYGGFPYKQHLGQSADASNALIATNALDEAGLAKDSEVRKRVGTYVSKILNNSEANTGETEIEVDGEKRVVVSGVDMGAFYRPGESKAGMVKRSDGKWEFRSYGSMTYAALKLMMFAGIPAKDPRVQGVVTWISNHWTLKENPGFESADDPVKAGQQGMYYYLYTVTRALAAYEQATGKPLVVTDADGRTHNWRAEVAAELLMRQADDGSWRNEVAERWEEGSKTLATSFAMQTLAYLTGRLR